MQDCTEKSFCNGETAHCPRAATKEGNKTECNDGTQVCQQGDCKGSICLKYGMEQCFLSSMTKRSTTVLGNCVSKLVRNLDKTVPVVAQKTGLKVERVSTGILQ